MRRFSWWMVIWLLVVPALACTVPVIGKKEPPPTPTPQGDTLILNIPLYRANLEPGETVLGTKLTYVAPNNNSYDVTIDGLAATKNSGDSFAWSGVVAPSMMGSYNLRLTATVFGKLLVIGPVDLTIFNPQPMALATPPTDFPLYYNDITIDYLVPSGNTIPGTTWLFETIVEPGGPENVPQKMARLSGTTGYPYYALADSLVWTGQLLPHISVRYNLRVAGLDENGLRVAGTAELWVKP